MANDIVLRPYQQRFIAELRSQIKHGQRRICGVAPCGAGKTIMMGFMIKGALELHKRAIFFVHRKELIDQTADTFLKLGIPFSTIAEGVKPDYSLPVQIALVQTLVNRLHKLPPPDLLVCDECHHILADSYLKIVNHWKDAVLIGVTATPERTGGVRLGDVFSSMVEAPTVSELIEMGNLTNFKYFSPVAPADLNLDKLRVKYGEYVNSDVEVIMTNSNVVGNIVYNYKRYANGTPAICYCVNVRHSKYVADNFLKAGISAAHVDGVTPKSVRNQIVQDFRAGRIQVLCNAELFGEGFDVPNVHTVILARPTMSLTLYVQQSMRGMRPDPVNPNKTAIIIDHVRNHEKFGLPDEPRTWSLVPNREKVSLPHNKVCPECAAVLPSLTRICPNCGYEFFAKSARDSLPVESNGAVAQIYNSDSNFKAHVDFITATYHRFMRMAELSNYKPYWAALRAIENARSYDDCLIVANLAGYKKGWAYHQWQDLKSRRKNARFARAR